MYKALFLPLLSIPSGHHQSADALMDRLNNLNIPIECKKIDILSYRLGKMEKLISTSYLKWIHRFPKTYSWLYQKLAYRSYLDDKSYWYYRLLFERTVQKIISLEKPDMIICTHALPSRIIDHLKSKQMMDTPVINVYTDFFINQVWGLHHVDAHFVSTYKMKSYLLEKGVSEEKIYVTGIPIHPSFQRASSMKRLGSKLTILISGGSMGVGTIEKLLQKLPKSNHIQYFVLCGKNEKLYHYLIGQNNTSVVPFPYIQSREKMNLLYEKADAMITKPGGVTISECINKKVPIFIYHTLPGQEEINLQQLSSLHLVRKLPSNIEKDEWMTYFFSTIKEYHERDLFEQFERQLSHLTPEKILMNYLTS